MSDTLAGQLRITLLARVEEFCRSRRMSEATFGLRAANESRLVKRLREGGNLTLSTADKVEAFIAAQHQASAPVRQQDAAA